MIGYKAFNNDMTCRDFQYKIGNRYIMRETPIICSRGFHFCKNLEDVFDYYPFGKHTRVCKIETQGTIDTKDNIKFCTNKIIIQEEINFDHLLQLRYKKEAISNSIDLSTIEIGTKIHIKNHTLICVSIQNDKYIFAFDEIVTQLPVYKLYSFIHNLNNFKDWLPQEWLDNIEEIFIPNEYEVYGSYFWTDPENEPLLPFAYYKYRQNRIKYIDADSISWWLSGMVYSANYVSVGCQGFTSYNSAFNSDGVVPHFIIKKRVTEN